MSELDRLLSLWKDAEVPTEAEFASVRLQVVYTGVESPRWWQNVAQVRMPAIPAMDWMKVAGFRSPASA